MATQKGNVDEVLEALEKGWQQLFSRIPDVITRGVEIKLYLDTLYMECFPENLPEGVKVMTKDGLVDPRERQKKIVLPPGVSR